MEVLVCERRWLPYRPPRCSRSPRGRVFSVALGSNLAHVWPISPLVFVYCAERVGLTRIQPAPTRARGGLGAGFAPSDPTRKLRVGSKTRTDPNLGPNGPAGCDLPRMGLGAKDPRGSISSDLSTRAGRVF